jgi:hypothetical protein
VGVAADVDRVRETGALERAGEPLRSASVVGDLQGAGASQSEATVPMTAEIGP